MGQRAGLYGVAAAAVAVISVGTVFTVMKSSDSAQQAEVAMSAPAAEDSESMDELEAEGAGSSPSAVSASPEPTAFAAEEAEAPLREATEQAPQDRQDMDDTASDRISAAPHRGIRNLDRPQLDPRAARIPAAPSEQRLGAAGRAEPEEPAEPEPEPERLGGDLVTVLLPNLRALARCNVDENIRVVLVLDPRGRPQSAEMVELNDDTARRCLGRVFRRLRFAATPSSPATEVTFVFNPSTGTMVGAPQRRILNLESLTER